MKKLITGVFVAGLLFTACKSKQLVATQEAVSPQPETKVFAATPPPTQAAPAYQPPASSTYQQPAAPVRTWSESFSFTDQGDAGANQGNYFVIVGSFSSPENANRFKQELVPLGFNPVVLHGESGYYRVCVNSYNDEQSARSRIQQIRTQYPKYADTWLLIRKKK